MIPFEQAFKLVMETAVPLRSEAIRLDEALHRVLAEDVKSDIDMPPFNKSAMDGYACRRADLPGPLTVVEIVQAGCVPTRPIGKNECAKIMTGAPIPPSADCVIMVEQTEVVGGGAVRFTAASTADHICIRGEDIRAGDTVLRAGARLEPQHIAVLATVGCVRPRVSRRPQVGVIATGDELVEPDVRPGPSQIRTSNSYQICGQIRAADSFPRYYGIARDTESEIDAAMKRAMSENEVIIASGGVSMGDFDLVPDVMRRNGFEIRFDSIAMKPGKPTTFAMSKTQWCFGLPGNPVSTYIQFELLIKPFLYRLMGHDYRVSWFVMPLGRRIARVSTEREAWVPVRFEGETVVACDFHGSAHINALPDADGLIMVPCGVAELEEGDLVRVRPI